MADTISMRERYPVTPAWCRDTFAGGKQVKAKTKFITIYDDAGALSEGFYGTNERRLLETALNYLGYTVTITEEPAEDKGYDDAAIIYANIDGKGVKK